MHRRAASAVSGASGADQGGRAASGGHRRRRRPGRRARRARRPGCRCAAPAAAAPPATSSPGFASSTTPAAACTGSSLRARPAPSRQAATPTASASQPLEHARPVGAAPPRRAAAAGSGAAGSPPCAAIIAPPHGYAAPDASTVGRVGVGDPGQRQHLAGQRHGQLDHVGRAAAAQHLDRLGHLERVADGPAERRGHVGEQGGGRARRAPSPMPTIVAASSRARAGVFMNAPEPDLDVEHQRRPCPRRSSCS